MAGGSPPVSGFLSALRRSGREVEAVVQGRSMAGCFADGERILVRPATGAPPAAGDIVLHLGVDGRLVVHRVVAAGRNRRRVPFVITRGDNQTLCDMPVDLDEIHGTVTAMCRGEARVPPPPPPARRGWRAAVGRLALTATAAWAWVSSGPQRRRVASALWRRRQAG